MLQELVHLLDPDLHENASNVFKTDRSLRSIARQRRKEMLNRADHAAVAAGQADELANLAGADSELIAPDSTLLATDPTPNCAPPPAPRAAATLAGLPEHLAVYQRYLAAPPPHAIGDSFPDLSRLALTTDFRRRQDTINRSIKSGHTSGSVGARQKRQLDSWQKRIIAAYRDDKRLHNHRRHHAANTELVTAETGVDEALLLSGTGWSGMQRGMAESPTKAQDLLARGFRFVASHGERAIEIRSADGFRLLTRTSRMSDAMVAKLTNFTHKWHRPEVQRRLSVPPNRRGDHRLTLIGVTRAYETGLHFTSTHAKEPDLVEEMSADPDLAALSAWVSEAVRTHFPAVHARLAAADPGRKDANSPFRCRFGIYPLFCLNYAERAPVECVEHTDYKNVAAGICAVMAYGNFDSSKRHFLVFHDLKLAIEFPAGTVALYPSALLSHSNVSLVEAATPEDAAAGHGQERGSLVWFAQANYMISRELGMAVKDAAARGIPTTFDGVRNYFST